MEKQILKPTKLFTVFVYAKILKNCSNAEKPVIV